MIVVDTSVIVKWLAIEDGHVKALGLLDKGLKLACPDFAFVEVANVYRRKVRLGDISHSQAAASLAKLPKFFDLIVPITELLDSSFALAAQLDHSVYDCVFLALSVRETGSILITADLAFFKKCAVAGFSENVRSLDDYVVVTRSKSENPNG